MSRREAMERLEDAQLLGRRIASLGLSLRSSQPASLELRARLQRLWAELRSKGIRFEPHAWLSSEFFSPDGVPGIAIPFYLASPRLMILERSQSMTCEGQDRRECMQILRHEAGHGIDTAFELHRRAEWRRLFGLRSAPYLRSFCVDPLSDDYVRHLPNWYAQSHPAEDFAETFAVWLDPGSAWRRRYPSGLARQKLDWVHEVMRELAGSRPTVHSLEETESIRESELTLGEHYARQKRRRANEPPNSFDKTLARAFEAAPGPLQRSSAASYLQKHGPAIQRRLRPSHRQDSYLFEQILCAMVLQCRRQGLRLRSDAAPPGVFTMARWVDLSLHSLGRGKSRPGR